MLLGQAGFYYDASFNGLSVGAWQTCEAPHVSAHEGNRALAALTVAEAFRTGGTMEIRFDRHPERAVPARLQQFARTRGITLGAEDRQAIAPAEARELIQVVTPMPDELAARVRAVTDRGEQTAERACYVLLAGVWRAIELDYLLATSPRAASILAGGSGVLDRAARQAESALCRAAMMIGTLHARLALPAGEATNAEAIEDERLDLSWSVRGATGAVVFYPPWTGRLPWQRRTTVCIEVGRPLLVLPRAVLCPADVAQAADLAAAEGAVAATLEAPDMLLLSEPRANVARLVYPDRLQAMDSQIERRLLASRVGRA